MSNKSPKIGWIGVGRMGYQMAERLAKADYDISIWNRTKSKAEPLTKVGAKVVDKLADLSASTCCLPSCRKAKTSRRSTSAPTASSPLRRGRCPRPSSIARRSRSTTPCVSAPASRKRVSIRLRPVSGNGQVIKAGKLSSVVSGPEAASKAAMPVIEVFAPRGVSYVGDGELARICKIAHNVMLGVVISNLVEITLLANKMGVPREALPRLHE